jgi:tRNA threonylcarbamoyl adenosine modification protein YeaZ
VLLLALDTATSAVTVAVTRGGETLAAMTRFEPRRHGEVLAPMVVDVLQDAALDRQSLDAVIVGVGPGPFTGLRVGLMTARTLGAVLGVPVLGVCSLDALARASDLPGPLLVATDARRREVYWAAYDALKGRIDGPHVQAPADFGTPVAAGDGARLYAERLAVRAIEPYYPPTAGLVAVAASHLLAKEAPAPLTPLYLRRPDAVEPSARKRVTT